MENENQISYPATNKFERFLNKEQINWEDATEPGEQEAKLLHEMLGEYEHGQVDLDVVLKLVGMEVEARTAKMYYKMGPSDPESSASMEFENETYAIVEEARKKALMILEGIYEDIILTAKYSKENK